MTARILAASRSTRWAATGSPVIGGQTVAKKRSGSLREKLEAQSVMLIQPRMDAPPAELLQFSQHDAQHLMLQRTQGQVGEVERIRQRLTGQRDWGRD